MGVSNRGPRGIPSRTLLGPMSQSTLRNLDLPAAGGAWSTAEVFTASGTFIAPSSGVRLNRRGKVEVFVTATAAGGCGGRGAGDDGVSPPGQTSQPPAGGNAGEWCRRFKVELDPGEYVSVTIPAAPTEGNNGASLTFGAYLTLAGGTKGADGTVDGTQKTGNTQGGTVVSGSDANDNVIRKGAGGGDGGSIHNNSTNPNAGSTGERGQDNPALGNFRGGSATTGTSGSPWAKAGGGGAGLWGNGGDGRTTSASTAGGDATGYGAGGGGGGNAGTNNGGLGAPGKLIVEWRIAA